MNDKATRLDRLSDTDLTLATGERDVRGLAVTDPSSEKMGTVTGIYVDAAEARVRFIQVRGGGVLGLGDSEHIVPAEAIDRIDADTVRIRHSGERVKGGPTYDPKLVREPSYWDGVYGYYGYPLTWGAAYPVGYYGAEATAAEAHGSENRTMDARDLLGMAVVSLDGAERLGRVRDVLFETEPMRVAALALDTDSGQRAVALTDVERVGEDAIVAETRSRALASEPRLAVDQMPGMDALRRLKVIDDAGTFMGQIEGLEIDPATGAVESIAVARRNALGISGETTSVEIDQVQSVGGELLTVRRGER